MSLSLAGKTPAKFEWAAGNMTAAFVISPSDGQSDILATLEEIISFVKTQQAKAAGRPPSLMERFGQAQAPDAPQEAPQAPANPGNGWAAVVPVEKPALPERLMGEVEMIEGEE